MKLYQLTPLRGTMDFMLVNLNSGSSVKKNYGPDKNQKAGAYDRLEAETSNWLSSADGKNDLVDFYTRVRDTR
jgi:hypothetical protein